MAIFAYDSSIRMAFSDDPSLFKNEEDARTMSSYTGECLVIEEWQTYYVKFYADPAPLLLKQSLEKANVVRVIQHDLWELNFRNFVGLSRIGPLNFQILNKKISDELYQDLLGELAEKYSALVFSFSSPVGQHYRKDGVGNDSAFVEYLFLRKFLLHGSPDINAISDILVYGPHRKFEKELQPCSIEECQAADIAIVHTLLNSPMARLRDNHPLQQTNLGTVLKAKTRHALYPVRAAKEIKYLTVDTHENRFVKFFLRMLQAKVESLHVVLSDGVGSYFNPNISDELELLRKKIGQFLSHNMWREVGEMRFIPASSQALQRKDGYRQLFSLYSLLQLATHCDFLATDFKNLVEIKDVPTIYEYWCFFQIKAIMDSFSPIFKVSRIVNDNPLTHSLSSGLCFDYACGVQLFFNKSYNGSTGSENIAAEISNMPVNTSYSHTLRPDIVIVQNGRKLIFDAKYKGQRSGFYGEANDGTIQRWKDEDIDKMHTYHDAIKGVQGSFILYPGFGSIYYPCYDNRNYFNGVGAIALRPQSISAGTRISANENDMKGVISAFLGR